MTGVTILIVLLIGVVQPYKSPINDRLDMVLLLTAAMGALSTVLFDTAHMEHHRFIIPTVVVEITFGVLPLAYIIAVSVHWLLIRNKIPQRIYHKVCRLLNCDRLVRRESLEELPADPEEREPLLEAPTGVDPDSNITPGDQDTYPVFLWSYTNRFFYIVIISHLIMMCYSMHSMYAA